MPQFTFDYTAEEGLAVQHYATKQNARLHESEQKPPIDFVREFLRHWLDARVAELREDRQREWADIENRLSAGDRAIVEGLRDKYRIAPSSADLQRALARAAMQPGGVR